MGLWSSLKESAKKSLETEKEKQLVEKEKQLAAKEKLKQLDEEGTPYCPKCKSTSLSAEKRGFKLGRALLFAPAGFIGRKKMELHCLKCGNKFKASLK